MIFTLGSLVFVLISWFLLREEILEELAGFCMVISCIVLLFCLLGIISSHILVEYQINTDHIEYEGLCKKLETIDSDYEDISKTNVIDDITEWNARVYSEKCLSNSLWTNWMYNKKIADSLQYIEY